MKHYYAPIKTRLNPHRPQQTFSGEKTIRLGVETYLSPSTTAFITAEGERVSSLYGLVGITLAFFFSLFLCRYFLCVCVWVCGDPVDL